MNSAKRGAVYGFKLQSLDMVGIKDQVLNYTCYKNHMRLSCKVAVLIILITSSSFTFDDFHS